MGRLRIRKCSLPPPPSFKGWKRFGTPSPFSMAKTSSYRVKTTPKLVFLLRFGKVVYIILTFFKIHVCYELYLVIKGLNGPE